MLRICLKWGLIAWLISHEASFEGESGLPWSFRLRPTLQKSEEQGAENGFGGSVSGTAGTIHRNLSNLEFKKLLHRAGLGFIWLWMCLAEPPWIWVKFEGGIWDPGPQMDGFCFVFNGKTFSGMEDRRKSSSKFHLFCQQISGYN